jgi:hypothetical protein
MKKYTVSGSVTAAPAAAKIEGKQKRFAAQARAGHPPGEIRGGGSVRPRHTAPATTLAPAQFVPWVQARLDEGFEVHVVYESCGLGYGLYRALLKPGAHCYVIAPQKLDEGNTRVKTDGRDGRGPLPALGSLPRWQQRFSGRHPGAQPRGGARRCAEVHRWLNRGLREVVDADLSGYLEAYSYYTPSVE